MSVQLSGSVIAAIYAQGDTPDTPEEWIIAAINLGGILASGDIKADGSVAFTGQETFQAGIRLNNGTVAAVALGNSATNGLIFGVNTVSIVTNGIEKWVYSLSGGFNPVLDNQYDIGNGAVNPRDITVSRNLITGSIVEKTVNSGVAITGAASADGTYVLIVAAATAGANVGTQIQLEVSPTPTLLAPGNIWNDSTSKGLSFVDGNNNTATIVRNTGWTASVGTESKGGIDSDDVIYTVGALQNLARTVAAIQNTLMNTHGFFGT